MTLFKSIISILSLLVLLFNFSCIFACGPPGEQLALQACESNLKNLAVALEMYSTDYMGDYPPSLDKFSIWCVKAGRHIETGEVSEEC